MTRSFKSTKLRYQFRWEKSVYQDKTTNCRLCATQWQSTVESVSQDLCWLSFALTTKLPLSLHRKSIHLRTLLFHVLLEQQLAPAASSRSPNSSNPRSPITVSTSVTLVLTLELHLKIPSFLSYPPPSLHGRENTLFSHISPVVHTEYKWELRRYAF